MSLRKFDRSNFNFWKEKMQDYLIVKGQIDPIETEKLDRIVCAPIRMHLSELVYFTMQSCSTTFELWKTLSETYEKKVASTKMYLTGTSTTYRSKNLIRFRHTSMSTKV